MSGMDVLWDADPDTTSGILDPVNTSSAPSKRMTFAWSKGMAASGPSSDDGRSELRGSAGIVLGSLALLWFLGAVVFKDVRL